MYSLSALQQHLETHWGSDANKVKWSDDPHGKIPVNFTILEFPPNEQHGNWIYSTLGMSHGFDDNLIELHIISIKQDLALVELLTAATSFHRHNASLGLHHTVNFGRPWQDDSSCDYGFISLPYLNGETLEVFEFGEKHLHNLWLIPITESEREFKIKNGWDALEERFEACELDYINPHRQPCA